MNKINFLKSMQQSWCQKLKKKMFEEYVHQKTRWFLLMVSACVINLIKTFIGVLPKLHESSYGNTTYLQGGLSTRYF